MLTTRRFPFLRRKNRTPILFDDTFYRQQSADLMNVGDSWKHYCKFGFRENRNPHPLFHTAIYREKYLDGRTDVNPVLHYLERHVPLASTHPLFDAEAYVRQIGGLPPTTLLEHYLSTDVRKLAPASAFFDSQSYLDAYPDVAASNANPLLHFLQYGIDEQRVSFVDPIQFHQLSRCELHRWLQSAPYIRPRDFLFNLLHSREVGANPPTVICVSRDASTADSSQFISRLATALRGQGGFNVANLLLDGGELLARFESSGSTVSLEKVHSTAVHTTALLRYFLQTVQLFQPIGAFVDRAAADEVLQPLKEFGIPIRVLSHDSEGHGDVRPEQLESLIGPFLQKKTVVAGKPELAAAKATTRLRQEPPKRVYFLSPSWEVSGVNTFTELLCRELNQRDYEASILLTDNVAMALPPERLPRVPYRFLHATRPPNSVKNARLAEFLAAMAPAVVVPNFDYRSSSISAVLPENVRTLGILHSDDVDHYTHAYRMGHSWERIVSVSATIERKLLLLNPAFENKSLTINYGVDAPHDLVNKTARQETVEKLRIVYSGRLVQQQKRILDFADLLQSLEERGVPFEFTMIGDGQEADELRELASPFVESGQLRMLGRLQPHEIYAELVEHHVICLMSDYEGLPLSLLEGLACGCIPVMTQIESGVSEILDHERNALISPLRSPGKMADNLHRLYRDNALRMRLATAARPTLESHRLTSSQMVDQYEEVLSQMFESIDEGSANAIPSYWRCNWVDRLLNAA